jgi:hypothetical protein
VENDGPRFAGLLEVELAGLEPATSWVRSRWSPKTSLAPSKGFGFVDAEPLRRPEPAERVARYLSKYLANRSPDGSMEITETHSLDSAFLPPRSREPRQGTGEPFTAAGRTLLNYVSRNLTAKSGVTMRILRNVRIAWAWTQGYLPGVVLDPFDLVYAVFLLEQFRAPSRAP